MKNPACNLVHTQVNLICSMYTYVHIRYRSIITSFLHAWTRVAPREIFKYSRSVFAWTTISRGVEHTRLVYHHAWLLHARLLHAWPLHAWLLHTWLAITRVAGYYTRGWLLQAALIFTGQGVLGCTCINREKTREIYVRKVSPLCMYILCC